MGEKARTSSLRLVVGKNPLRTVGNLLLLWLVCLIALLIMSFPYYPQTRPQWLWFIVGGPFALFIYWVGIEWIGTLVGSWFKGRSPELRIWESILIVLAILALVAWGIHSIP